MIEEYLSFYGDTDEIKNKLYTWKINSITDLEARLKYWHTRVDIRAAWYLCKEDGKIIQNARIDLTELFSRGDVLFLNNLNL